MLYLVSVANVIMGFLGGTGQIAEYGLGDQFQWVTEITEAIKAILWPLLIVVGSAGTVYAVVLGVNMARADSTEKREEAKKRLINVLVGIAIVVGLILFFNLLIDPNNGILVQLLNNSQ